MEDFERSADKISSASTHHEEYQSFQENFAAKCVALKEAFLRFDNPFKIDALELICLDTRVVIEKKGRDILYALEENGVKLYRDFVNNRLAERTKSLYDSVPKQHTNIFTTRKKTAGPSTTLSTLKEDVHLFSRLFIISTARDLDLNEFFQYENNNFPPSLSLNGDLRPGLKAQLTTILEKLVLSDVCGTPICSGVVFDGAALAYLVKPKPNLSTFEDYCDTQLKPYLLTVAKEVKAERIDLVWDMYAAKSLKATTRDNRGSGLRQHDLPSRGDFFYTYKYSVNVAAPRKRAPLVESITLREPN